METLEPEEARVLGTLIEKSLATPDYYPMTLNALRTACNQKSAREPVTSYDDAAVVKALAGLKRKTLVAFIPYGSGGTQFKYRHFLEDARFRLGAQELAILSVLLLRGAQTLNEIKLRASSQREIPTLEAAEALLRDLAARQEPLVEFLPKRRGWKEPRWRDTLRVHAELPAEAHEGDTETAGEAAAESAKAADYTTLAGEVAALKAEVADLRAVVDKLMADLG